MNDFQIPILKSMQPADLQWGHRKMWKAELELPRGFRCVGVRANTPTHDSAFISKLSIASHDEKYQRPIISGPELVDLHDIHTFGIEFPIEPGNKLIAEGWDSGIVAMTMPTGYYRTLLITFKFLPVKY